MIKLINRILKNGRAFNMPNTNQFATIKKYRAFAPCTAEFRKGFGWVRIKL